MLYPLYRPEGIEVPGKVPMSTTQGVPSGAKGSLIFGDATSDYLVVALLATGLAEIAERRRRRQAGFAHGRIPRNFEPQLLPGPWRAAAARLWWRFQGAGVAPPADDLALMQLCRVPFCDWDVHLNLSEIDSEMALLDGDELTELAHEAARVGVPDVEADFIEERTFAMIKAVAELNGTTPEGVQHNYERLRRFLIDNTVLSDKQVRTVMREFPSPGTNGQPLVQTLIEIAFERRTSDSPTVQVTCCSDCGNPLAERANKCGTPGCVGAPSEKQLSVFEAYFVQHRGVRRYIHDAGLLEVRLHDTLRAALPETAVFLRPWPERDAFDLLIAFLDPRDPDPGQPVEVWGVDGKDHASPTLLAIGFHWKYAVPCHRRFIVLPTHRAEQPGYVPTLTTELEGRDVGIEVVEEEKFVAMVRARAAEMELA